MIGFYILKSYLALGFICLRFLQDLVLVIKGSRVLACKSHSWRRIVTNLYLSAWCGYLMVICLLLISYIVFVCICIGLSGAGIQLTIINEGGYSN